MQFKLENRADIRRKRLPLYHQYPGQYKPQDAFIEVDLKRQTVRAATNYEVGNAVPMDVWHGHICRIPISPYLSGKEIIALFDDNRSLIARMLSGYECVWDGSNNVARLSDDADAAKSELKRIGEESFALVSELKKYR